MTRMSEIGTEQAAPLAKPMPACMSFYAIRGEGMSTYMYMQYGVHVKSTESHRSNVRLLDRAATGATYIFGPYWC